ncbi:MAG: TrmH family RNA methyltransferase, partial [Phycisphaerales bacterium]
RLPPTPIGDFLADSASRPGPLVVMEDLTNHDNIGSIFRSAACLGASGILLSPRCADPLYRKAVRVSMGHILHVPFAVAADWPQPLDEMTRLGWTLAVMTPDADAANIRDLGGSEPKPRRVALLVGTEGQGVSLAAKERATLKLRIGMVGGVDSLNVAVAAGIALHCLGRL